jgi:hypothetical protein
MRTALAGLLLSLAIVAGTAEARSEKTLAYQRDQAWPAAVRFLRVDAKLKIIEKDADAGFVIFEYREDNKTFRGSLEVIDIVKDGRKLVRFVIQIEDRPSWVEIEMLTKLERKLRAELGAPAPAPSPKEPPKQEEPAPDKPADKPANRPKDDGPPVSDTP